MRIRSENFKYQQGDSEHLKIELLKLLVDFQHRGEKIPDEAKAIVKSYVSALNLEDASEFLYIDQRIEFLVNAVKLTQNSIDVYHLEDALTILAYSHHANNGNVDLPVDQVENAYNQRKNPAYWYSDYDVKLILESYLEDKNHDAIVAAVTVNELPAIIREYQKDKKPRLIALHVNGNHWVSLVIIPPFSQDQKPFVLYKDSLGLPVKQGLQEQFNSIAAEFKCHSLKQQENDSSHCGIFAIANLKKIADSIKDQDKVAQFVGNFEKSEGFIDLEEAKSLRQEKFADLYLRNICANKYKGYISAQNTLDHWMKIEGERLDEYRQRFSGQDIANRRAKEQLTISYDADVEYLVISLSEKLNAEEKSASISNTVLTQVVKIAQSSENQEVIKAVVNIYNKIDVIAESYLVSMYSRNVCTNSISRFC